MQRGLPASDLSISLWINCVTSAGDIGLISAASSSRCLCTFVEVTILIIAPLTLPTMSGGKPAGAEWTSAPVPTRPAAGAVLQHDLPTPSQASGHMAVVLIVGAGRSLVPDILF